LWRVGELAKAGWGAFCCRNLFDGFRVSSNDGPGVKIDAWS